MKQSTSSAKIVIGMLNGMIGGVILVLPLLTLSAGSVETGIIILFSGLFSYYSCMLCVKHLGTYSDLDQAIMHHFNMSMKLKIFYDFIVFFNLFLILILYFELIVQQWEGMLPSSIAIPICNYIILLALIFLIKYYEFGVNLLAYGIISTIGYCLFLIWMIATAPQGKEQMPKFGSGGVQLAAAMGQAFSIQTFFIPVLRKNNNQSKYQIYVMITYYAGLIVYMYIAYVGGFGILHQTPSVENPQTILAYFDRGQWQVHTLQIIYLIHLYSAFPQFLIVSNKRFLSIFQRKMTGKLDISKQQVIYTVIFVSVCLTLSLASVQIEDVITINGAVVGFFFIYLLPLITHIQCVYVKPIKNWYLSKQLQSQNYRQYIQITAIQASKNKGVQQNLIYRKPSILSQVGSQSACDADETPCCYAQTPTLPFAVLDIIMCAGMLASGIFVMYAGIKKVAAH